MLYKMDRKPRDNAHADKIANILKARMNNASPTEGDKSPRITPEKFRYAKIMPVGINDVSEEEEKKKSHQPR